ncbi:nucleoporin-interacting protein [Paenibacillus sp. sptzw28]|uniref:nucleoporin-interacting protein n=1 Tax=Paenibacillus sp. sptzw28 TaxID=715179 RepID=UPI001C6E7E7B|nr:nucleoporin-interacting protein [Paenibacillus sp. sptzw28]QYR22063.1 nucleoporin-interacting protein [Paenibacillus sp. sptzw28]
MMHLSPYAATWDEVDFVLALDRFDLLAMQPHFPGYPYFVLAAMAVHQFVPDPVYAFGVVNVLLTASSAAPVWLIARRIMPPVWSVVVVLTVMTSPYLWLQALRPMSEAAGIALLWWFLWSWWRAMECGSWGRTALALCMFGLLMGVRLSFAAWGLAIVWLLFVRCAAWRREGKRMLPRIIGFGAAAAAFQLLWLARLALSEGGVIGFAKLAVAFTEGHFSDWGGGVSAADHMSFAERVFRFTGDNLLWSGMFARSMPLLAAAAALLLAAVLRAGSSASLSSSKSNPLPLRGRASAWLRRPALPGALAVLAGAYGVWALLAQNIDKPRHITPLIGVIWLLLLTVFRAIPQPDSAPGSPPGSASSRAVVRGVRVRRALQAAGLVLAACVIAFQSAQGGALAIRQADEPPAVYQLAAMLSKEYGADDTNRAVVYTWEETRVLEYLHTPVANRQILTYSYFIADVKANPAATILLTDHVLNGFEAQVGSLRSKVKAVASFRSEALFDPVYHDITLYEWIR